MRRNVLQVTLVHVAIMNIFDKIKFKKHSFKAVRQTFECFKLTFIYTLLVPMPTSAGRILHQVDTNTYSGWELEMFGCYYVTATSK